MNHPDEGRLERDPAEDRILKLEERFTQTVARLEHRVKALRRRVALLTLLLLGAAALGAAVWMYPSLLPQDLTSRGSASGEVVQARAFELVDADGRSRGLWNVADDGTTRLALRDRRGEQRLNLTVLQSGHPGLSFVNEDGERRVVLGILPDETSNLVFADADGVPRAVLGLSRARSANLLLADGDGVSRIGLALDRAGSGSVLLPDSLEGPPAEGAGMEIDDER